MCNSFHAIVFLVERTVLLFALVNFILFKFILLNCTTLDMQTKLLETELALDEALLRASAEKDRRKTLHNVLVVRKTLM